MRRSWFPSSELDGFDCVWVPQVESSGAGDTEKSFVAGKHEGIDRQIPQGYRYVACDLCSVHEEEDAVIVEEFADFPDILHRTKYVACVGHDHESGVGSGRMAASTASGVTYVSVNGTTSSRMRPVRAYSWRGRSTEL